MRLFNDPFNGKPKAAAGAMPRTISISPANAFGLPLNNPQRF